MGWEGGAGLGAAPFASAPDGKVGDGPTSGMLADGPPVEDGPALVAIGADGLAPVTAAEEPACTVETPLTT